MRRWNGWGEEHVDYPLDDAALAFLSDRIGSGITPDDVTLETACAKLGPSRLAPHKLVDTSAPARLRASFGQSLQEWLRLRFGETGSINGAHERCHP